MNRIAFAGLLLALSVVPAGADTPALNLVAALAKKAALTIDGKRRVLAVGERSPEGVTLLSVTPDQARIEINGDTRDIKLGDRLVGKLNKPKQARESIYRTPGGMYLTQGHINGLAVPMMIDTGAGSVAMDQSTADRLGIDYRLNGRPQMYSTANGQVVGYEIDLREVSLGAITLHGVRGAVLPMSMPQVLLGMSFLGRLEMHDQGERLDLRKRF